MSYAKQGPTIKRLQLENRRALGEMILKNRSAFQRLWFAHRNQLKAAIADSYRSSVSRGTWHTPAFNRVKPALQAKIRAIMQQFHAQSIPHVKKAVTAVYDQSLLRHAWALDQVTPASQPVRVPAKKSLREAEIINDPQSFAARWSTWLEAYNSALVQNLGLNAIKEGSMTDATDLVDQTKANFPAWTLIDALNRIFTYETFSALSDGQEDVGDANADAVEAEIWRTRGDVRVCDDCDANEGQSVDDVGFPPEHPNCHCFTEVVPTSFADLLRSGDEADNDLADDMERQGLVPTSLVIRGDDGTIGAKAIVDFSDWADSANKAIMGQ